MNMKKIFYEYINELKRSVTDFGVMLFFVLVPLGYPLLYTYIYSQEVVRDIPVAVCNMSGSNISREFVQKTDASPDVAIAAWCTNMLSARELMKEDKVKGIIYIPESFSNNIYNGEQAHISIYCSMASLFYYKAILVACTQVSLSMNKDIQIKRLVGATQREGEVYSMPLEYQAVGMANSTTGFANFVIPAILVLILQQTMLLGIGMRMGTDRERGLQPTPHKLHTALALTTGRGLAYLTIYIPVTAYVLCVVPTLFALTQLSHSHTLIIFMLPYLLSCIFFAITLGHLVRNRETGMLLFVFTSIPFLFLSGISWPGSSIPSFWKIASYLLPSTPGINGFVSINETGATLSDVLFEYRILWVQTAIYFATSTILTLKKNNQSRLYGTQKHLKDFT